MAIDWKGALINQSSSSFPIYKEDENTFSSILTSVIVIMSFVMGRLLSLLSIFLAQLALITVDK